MASIIVPAYNEEKRIHNVLGRMPGGHEVIVVDDGSIDNTSKIAKSYGHKTIRMGRNSGKGLACMHGARQSRHGLCIFIDGDGQLNPGETEKFIKLLKHYDIVIGQRKMNDIPLQRQISNRFARWCVNYLTNNNFSDVLCGFRGVRKGKFFELKFKKMGYFFECEMLLEASKKGMKIAALPVDVDYNTGSRMPFRKSMAVALWLTKNVIKKSVGLYN